jgi:ureidoacrylate peracid hydrolase
MGFTHRKAPLSELAKASIQADWFTVGSHQVEHEEQEMALAHSDSITIDARHEPVTAALSRTAVIVVDMQNDFATAGGMFERAGIDISVIRTAIEPTSRLIEAARSAGIRIVYLAMGFLADLSDAGAQEAPNWRKHTLFDVGQRVTAPDGSQSRILIRDTWNTAIIDELTPHPGDLVLWKHRFSGFFETALHDVLQADNIDTLLFVGATTSICVESTVRDAMYRDYHCLIVEDCVAEPIGYDLPRSNHDASLLALQLLFGSITNSAAVHTALANLVPTG